MTTVTKTKVLGKFSLGQMVDQDHLEIARTIYRETRWEFHSSRLGRNDSLSAWFNLSIVKEFIEKAKSIKANAVKIYFGVYPDNFVQRPEFSGLQTLLLVAANERNGMSADLYYIDEKGKKTTMSLNMAGICPPYCGSTTKVEGTPYDKEVRIHTAGAFVEQEYADELKKNYREQRYSYNNELIGKSDSLSVTFGIKEIEEFVVLIDQHRGDGIRFYYGAYPDYYEEMPEYSSMQTLVVVGIKQLKTTEGWMIKDMILTEDGNVIKNSLNMGSLCPPYCGGTTKVEGTPYDDDIRDIR